MREWMVRPPFGWVLNMAFLVIGTLAVFLPLRIRVGVSHSHGCVPSTLDAALAGLPYDLWISLLDSMPCREPHLS